MTSQIAMDFGPSQPAPERDPGGRTWQKMPSFVALPVPSGHRWRRPGSERQPERGDGETVCLESGKWIGCVCGDDATPDTSPAWATEALAQTWVEGHSARVLRGSAPRVGTYRTAGEARAALRTP